MQMSVAIGPYGSYDPVESPKPLWGISWGRTVYVVHFSSLMYKTLY